VTQGAILPGAHAGQSQAHPSHAAMTQLRGSSPMRPLHYRLWPLLTDRTLLSGASMFLLSVTATLGFIVVVSLLGLSCTWLFRIEGHGRTLEEHHRGDLP
jgi:hypothetical protein